MAITAAAPGAVEAFAAKHRTREHRPVIGMVTRFASEKGVEVLLDALPVLQARYPQAQVLFAGQHENVMGEQAYFERLRPRIRDHERYQSIFSGEHAGFADAHVVRVRAGADAEHPLADGEAPAVELRPARRQQQRPRRSAPAGELGVRDEAPGSPGVEHAAQGLARIAVQVDEGGIGERRGKKRHAQRVLRGLFQHACGAPQGGSAIAVTQLRYEPVLEMSHDALLGVGRVEPAPTTQP